MTVTPTAPLVAGEARPGAVPAEQPAAASGRGPANRTVPDIVDVWGCDSFPASDPPANW